MRGMRLSVTLLSVLPGGSGGYEAPSRASAAAAMAWAPAVGVLLGAAAGGALCLITPAAGSLAGAAVAIALLALLTRGLHLDGLADLADGLGSGKPAAAALEIMRKSDIGPMGVVTLVSALLIQFGSLAHAASVSLWHGFATLLAAVVTGRLAITWACRDGVPAARPEGLGALVAGTVRPSVAVLVTLVPLAGAGLAASLYSGFWTLPLALVAGLAAAALLQWHATRRLGGITGDVLGALCETATTVAVLVGAMGLR